MKHHEPADEAPLYTELNGQYYCVPYVRLCSHSNMSVDHANKLHVREASDATSSAPVSILPWVSKERFENRSITTNVSFSSLRIWDMCPWFICVRPETSYCPPCPTLRKCPSHSSALHLFNVLKCPRSVLKSIPQKLTSDDTSWFEIPYSIIF